MREWRAARPVLSSLRLGPAGGRIAKMYDKDTAAEKAAKTQKPPGGAKAAQESTISVWLVEDNHTFRNTVARVLNQVPALECPRHFSNAEDALAALEEGAIPDAIL